MGDFCIANKQVEKTPIVIPDQEASFSNHRNARFFGSIDTLQGYWQYLMAPESREIFIFITLDGLFTPERVPQGILNATAYF